MDALANLRPRPRGSTISRWQVFVPLQLSFGSSGSALLSVALESVHPKDWTIG